MTVVSTESNFLAGSLLRTGWEDWLMSRRGHSQLPVEERMRVVLAVLSGELTIAEAARRHGTPMDVTFSTR
jgi:hypothetical protein